MAPQRTRCTSSERRTGSIDRRRIHGSGEHRTHAGDHGRPAVAQRAVPGRGFAGGLSPPHCGDARADRRCVLPRSRGGQGARRRGRDRDRVGRGARAFDGAMAKRFRYRRLGRRKVVIDPRDAADADPESAARRIDGGVPVSGHLIDGQPAQVLREHAARLDLLVIGSRAHGSPGRMLFGSVSHTVVLDYPTPLLVVPRSVGAANRGGGREHSAAVTQTPRDASTALVALAQLTKRGPNRARLGIDQDSTDSAAPSRQACSPMIIRGSEQITAVRSDDEFPAHPARAPMNSSNYIRQ